MRKQLYSIFFTKTAEKQFNDLAKKVQREIALILEELARTPLIGKPLQGPMKGLRSIRFGHFRIIYEQRKDQLIVLIINIGHRKAVYKRKK